MDSQHDLAVKVCKIVILPIEEIVVNVGKNEFILYHQKISTMTQYCGDETSKTQISTNERIRIPDGCSILLDGRIKRSWH